MTDADASYRQTLKSTSIIGGATFGGLVISLVRNKVIALLVGPAGLGLLGLLSSVLTLGASVAGMGLNTSAVRQLAQRADDNEGASVARRAIWTFTWPLAVLGAIAVWAFRRPIAEVVVGDSGQAGAVGWLGIGVGLTIIATTQLAVVQGYRRIGDLARVRLYSAAYAAAAGIAAVYFFGLAGIVIALVATPLAGCLVGLWYSRNLPTARLPPRARERLTSEWRSLAVLGLTVMVTAAVGATTQAGVRAILTQRLGLEASGLFQAAFTVSAMNIALVFAAMAADFYPRLSASADNPPQMQRLVNDQIHIGVILAAPALVAIVVFAPLLLQLLYSSAFSDGSLLLRLLAAADVLRIVGWALGYALLARKASVSYFVVELANGVAYIPILLWLVPTIGVSAAGAGYVCGTLTSVLATLFLAARYHGIRVARRNLLLVAGLMLTCVGLALLFELNIWAGIVAGGILLIGIAYYSLREIARIGGSSIPAPLRRFIPDFLKAGP